MLDQHVLHAELSDSIYLSGREAWRFRVISNLHRQPSAHKTNSMLRLVVMLRSASLSLVILLAVIPNFLSFYVYNVTIS